MAAHSSSQRYMVTARKYRPGQFGELVAQDHVSDTLKNAIRLNRLAHAYLFSGPRGVGKTTAARILAKAINCTTPLENRDDGAEPCRECDSCQSFEEGRSLGIFEIDAASNNKVDDIRELRETVRVPPQGSRKKVYIIDEVHMLSNQAFNALLKTLEEPPPHVLFIFATTEPHKVLPTILSRCQRFDFRRIPVADIVQRLREICVAENISADEESLMLIAKKGDGALRDALSAFDQAVSLCGTDLTYTELVQALGVVDLELYFRLTDHIAQRDSSGVLNLVEEVVRSGYDLLEFLAGVAEHFRNLLVAASMEDQKLIQAAKKTRERYARQAENFSEADILRLLIVVADAEEDVKSSSQPRLKLEMALLKMASLSSTANLEQALAQLDRLEKAISDGDAIQIRTETPAENAQSSAADKASTASPEPAAGSSTTNDPKKGGEQSGEPKKRSTSENAQGEEQELDKQDRTEDASPAGENGDQAAQPTRDSSEPTSPSSAGEPDPSYDPDSSYKTIFSRPALDDPPDSSDKPTNQDSTSGAVATITAPVARAETKIDGSAPGELADHWQAFIQEIHEEKILLGSYLKRSRPLALDQETLRVAVPDTHSHDLLSNSEQFLVNQLPDELSIKIEGFDFVIRNDLEETENSETDAERDPYETLKKMRKEHDVVRKLFDTFGGEIVH